MFVELCEVVKHEGYIPQQLTDLAELMQSYGFPTPGWGWADEEDLSRNSSCGDAAPSSMLSQVL